MTPRRWVDVSPEYCRPPTAEDCACLLRNGIEGVIVGGSYSRPELVRQFLATFAAAGLRTGVYGFIDYTAAYPYGALYRALSASQGTGISVFMVDAELGVGALGGQAVVDLTRDAIRRAETELPAGIEVLLYTAGWWWEFATGRSHETFGLRAVLAQYPRDPDAIPDPAGLAGVGGWDDDFGNVWGWQYAGTIETCGLNTDRILVIAEDEMDAYTRAEVDAKVGALLLQVGKLGADLRNLTSDVQGTFRYAYEHAIDDDVHSPGTAPVPHPSVLQDKIDELQRRLDAGAGELREAATALGGT